MKRRLSVLVSLAAAGFAIVCLFQWKQINKLKKQTFLLHQTVEERDRKDEATHAKLRAVQRERSELSYRVDTLTNDLQALRATAVHRQVNPSSAGTQSAVVTDQEKHKGGFADWIARMIDDPAMKQMIRDQQAVMLDSTYGPLFKEMGLSPDETAKFKGLLIEQGMQGIDKASIFLRADGDGTDKAAMAKELSQGRDESDDQLKAFLGDARYAQYKDYTDTMAERMELKQFSEQLASSENPLTDDQTKQLLKIMKAEKRSIPEAFAGSTMTKDGDWQSMFSEEQMEKSFKQQEESNHRILQRASALLSPEQLQSLSSFQSSQLQMQRFGMTMAVKMFGTQKADDAPPANANR